MQIRGIISSEGKLLSPQSPVLTAWFKKNAGKPIKLVVTTQGKKRSTMQNSYYWSVIVPYVMDAMNELGNEWDEDATHEALKAKFNQVEVINKAGISDTVPGSTTELSTFEAESYYERIRMWAAQFLNIVIPLPNEAPELILITPTQHGFIAESTI